MYLIHSILRAQYTFYPTLPPSSPPSASPSLLPLSYLSFNFDNDILSLFFIIITPKLQYRIQQTLTRKTTIPLPLFML